MINPIKHFSTLNRISKPVRRIQERGYTEGYFMKPSPLAKNKDTIKESWLKTLTAKVKNLFNKKCSL